MLYLRSFNRFILISLSLLGISFSGQVQAALVLHHSGGPPVIDTDGGPMADINLPLDSFMFDVVYDSLGGTDTSGGVGNAEWGFAVGTSDTAEIPVGAISPFTWDPYGQATFVGASFVSNISLGGTSFLDYNTLGVFDLPVPGSVPPSFYDGFVLASFTVTPGILGVSPDDESADLVLAGLGFRSTRGLSIYDPSSGVTAGQIGYDAQFASPPSAVPVPAAVWLFGTALIGLVGFKKRRKVT